MTQRILEAVGGIAGSSLEQTSWLSRSLEVKVQPQVCVEAEEPDDADVDGDHYGNFENLQTLNTCIKKENMHTHSGGVKRMFLKRVLLKKNTLIC